MPVTGYQVAAALGDTDDRPARAQLLRRDPVIHVALEVERGLVLAVGIVEPVARAEPASGPAVTISLGGSLPGASPARDVSPHAGWSPFRFGWEGISFRSSPRRPPLSRRGS